MLAARSGSVDTATRLIENGADINAKESTHGQTALMVAAGLNRAELVKLLLARGADATLASSVVDLNALTAPVDFDPVPRHGGAGRADCDQPAEGSARADAALPLQRADRRAGRADRAAFCRAAGRRPVGRRRWWTAASSVNLPSPGDKATPLLVAIINGHFDIAAYLLEHGADPNLVSDAGRQPALRHAQRPVGADCRLPAAARAPAAEPHLPGDDAPAPRQGRRSEPAAQAQGLVLQLQLRSVQRRRDRRDAVLARGLCRRHRGHEDAGRRRRRPDDHDDEAAVAAVSAAKAARTSRVCRRCRSAGPT